MAGTEGRRAFAQKINRARAAEMRKQVSTLHAHGSLPKSFSLTGTGMQQPIPYNDIVDPVDFEEHLPTGSLSEDGPLCDIYEFPPHDITVTFEPRESCTLTPAVPEEGADLSVQVRHCLASYTEDWALVTRNFQKYGLSYKPEESEKQKGQHKGLTHQTFESDDYSERATSHETETTDQDKAPDSQAVNGPSLHESPLQSSCADPLIPGILDECPFEEQDCRNDDSRKKNRQSDLFSLLSLLDEEDCIEKRLIPDVPREHVGQRILIKCQSLKFEIDIEPIFASMALYDVKEKAKISENFYFDMNSDQMRALLKGHIGLASISTLARSAIFSITYPTQDIFLVIKLEKVLQQGDIGECAEPYVVLKDMDPSKVTIFSFVLLFHALTLKFAG
uniref:Dedicator of cytokinesis C/D N-terminal domain-containing protein n=1 Tax=Eptatretus burgeri TaxID=7764 RepID=A0A8C4QIF6_EPTBU